MKTKLFLLAGLLSAGMIFSSCQKDNELVSSTEPTLFADLSKPDGSGISDLNSRITLTNYPDPFVNETNIRFTLQRRTLLRIYVHEVRTSKSEMIFEGWRNAGTHVVVFDASRKEPGEFIAELVADNTTVKEIMYKLKGDNSGLNEKH